MSEGIRSAAWDEDFPSDADMAFRKEVEPAILEIEEAVQENGSLRSLVLKSFRPGDWATGLGVMISTLGGLPDVASVLMGTGTTAGMTARGAYKEWLVERMNIESNHMYFYYETRERLASLDRSSDTALPTAGPWAQLPVPETGGEVNLIESQSDVEREARGFMEENEPLLNEGGVATLQKIYVQGAALLKDLSADAVETTNELTTATQALTEAIRNPAAKPRETFELEKTVERLKPIRERKQSAFEEFSAFIDRAKRAYEEQGGNS
jgi:hypothetical protein